MTIWVMGFRGEDSTSRILCEESNGDFKLITKPLRHPSSHSILFRYGNPDYQDLDRKIVRDNLINQASNILCNIQKARSLMVMREHGVQVPDFTLNRLTIREEDFPLMGRRFHHSKGADIHYLTNRSELEADNSDYWTRFVPSIKEYRIHILFQKPVRMSRKEAGRSDAHPFIRNYDKGWVFQNVNFIEYHRSVEPLIEEAKKATQAMDLEYGAVDILLTTVNKPCILEINTAPRQEESGRQILREKILEHYRR